MADELKRCPFCGGEPILNEIEAHTHSDALRKLLPDLPDHPGSWTIECCDVGMIKDTRAEVVAAWNRRAAPADLDAEGLPPLPEPDVNELEPHGPPTAYSAAKVRQAQRDAIAADHRAREINTKEKA